MTAQATTRQRSPPCAHEFSPLRERISSPHWRGGGIGASTCASVQKARSFGHRDYKSVAAFACRPRHFRRHSSLSNSHAHTGSRLEGAYQLFSDTPYHLRRASGNFAPAQDRVTTHSVREFQRSLCVARQTCAWAATGGYQILREVLAQADFLTACSQHTLNDIQSYFGKVIIPTPEVIYNGVSLEDFERETSSPHPRPYVLAIGRLVQQKGFDVLIEAFGRAEMMGMDLLIAGEGPELGVLGNLSERLGLAGRIHFVGRANRPQAVALFKNCTFFVMPSRIEPLGIVNLEAMAAGKAVIASRVGGVPEIVLDRETGILVPGGDALELAAALSHLAGDAELRQRLGSAGHARAEQFSWTRIAAQYERIYRSVLRDSSRQSGDIHPVTNAALEPAS